jgi:hypothetical protein
MSDRTAELEARVDDLERAVRRLLLIVGAAGAMLSEVHRDDYEGAS